MEFVMAFSIIMPRGAGLSRGLTNFDFAMIVFLVL